MLRLYIIWAAVIAAMYTWGTMPTHYTTNVIRSIKGDKEGYSSYTKDGVKYVRWWGLPLSENMEDRRGD